MRVVKLRMTIEADAYAHKKKARESTGPYQTISINAGAFKDIHALKPTSFRVFNSADTRLVAHIKNPSKKITVIKFKDEETDDGFVDNKNGVRLDPNQPIEGEIGDRIVIRKTADKTVKEVHLYFEPDDYVDDTVLDPNERVPVLV